MFLLAEPYNFAFYDTHQDAARSFYAAHYTHFGAYEILMQVDEETPIEMEAFEARVRAYVIDPPRFEPPADAIAPTWSRLAYGTGQAMHWTHLLHSQLYDILTDDGVDAKRAAGERAISYYLSEPDVAFSTRGYGHRWMEGGGPWASTFREAYLAVNGILWAYHWHHAAVYEALMKRDPRARQVELDRVIQVFTDSVLNDLPDVMPLTAEVAPEFSRMFPAAAHIFDNLHMMHDVVNDIMAVAEYSLPEKEAEIERLRRNMSYAGQTTVEAPSMPMHDGHSMGDGGMRIPTRLPSGEWLPQGHPDAALGSMADWMRPLPPPQEPGSTSGGERLGVSS